MPHGKSAPTVSAQCAEAVASFTTALARLSVSGLSGLSSLRTTMSEFLDLLCGSCYAQVRDSYRFLNQESFFVSGICGRSGGDRCPLAIIDRIISNTPVVPNPTCGSLINACSASNCANTLNQIRTNLGCCAASLYNSTGSPLSLLVGPFDRCNIKLGAVCSGAAGLIYLSVTLLVAISAIAAFML